MCLNALKSLNPDYHCLQLYLICFVLFCFFPPAAPKPFPALIFAYNFTLNHHNNSHLCCFSGKSSILAMDFLPYTTLMYGNGPGHKSPTTSVQTSVTSTPVRNSQFSCFAIENTAIVWVFILILSLSQDSNQVHLLEYCA